MRLIIRAGAAALAAAALFTATAGPALADPRDRRPVQRVVRRPPPVAWGYNAPTYVPAPPPVVYAPPPPPPVVYGTPGISLNFTLR